MKATVVGQTLSFYRIRLQGRPSITTRAVSARLDLPNVYGDRIRGYTIERENDFYIAPAHQAARQRSNIRLIEPLGLPLGYRCRHGDNHATDPRCR